MNVKELKEIAPLADVYELNPDGHYIVFVEDNSRTSMSWLEALGDAIPNAVLFVSAEGVGAPKMFEVSK